MDAGPRAADWMLIEDLDWMLIGDLDWMLPAGRCRRQTTRTLPDPAVNASCRVRYRVWHRRAAATRTPPLSFLTSRRLLCCTCYACCTCYTSRRAYYAMSLVHLLHPPHPLHSSHPLHPLRPTATTRRVAGIERATRRPSRGGGAAASCGGAGDGESAAAAARARGGRRPGTLAAVDERGGAGAADG